MSIGIIACRMGIVAFIIPLVFLMTPELLLQGSLIDISVVFLTTLVACWALAGVTEGYLLGPLKLPARLLLTVSTAATMMTTGWISIVASLVILAVLFRQWQILNLITTKHN